MDEATRIEKGLEIAFGCTVHGWPTPALALPRWYQRRARRNETKITEALRFVGRGPLSHVQRLRYWINVRMGQGIDEDAGAYMWRCWCAALDLPHRVPAITYSGWTPGKPVVV